LIDGRTRLASDIAAKTKLRMKTFPSQLAINNNSSDHGAIQHDPSDAGQIDILVSFSQSEPEPQDRGKK